MKIRFLLSFVAASAAIASLYACGSSSEAASAASDGTCPSAGAKVCPNDTALTQSDVDDCTTLLNGACGSQYKAVLECEGNNVKCDSSGMFDTSAVESACSSQESAFISCEGMNPTTLDGG